MKAILTFIAIIVSAISSGCANRPVARVSYTPTPLPAVEATNTAPRPTISVVPHPVPYNRDSIVVVNNNPKGIFVDIYVGNQRIFEALPANDRTTVYPISTTDGQHIVIGTVVYTLTPTGEREIKSSFNRTLRMGNRNQFLVATWEVNPKGNPKITTNYSQDRGYSLIR